MTADQTPVTYGTQRKAAAHNRVAILEAAHELLAESAAVSMNDRETLMPTPVTTWNAQMSNRYT